MTSSNSSSSSLSSSFSSSSSSGSGSSSSSSRSCRRREARQVSRKSLSLSLKLQQQTAAQVNTRTPTKWDLTGEMEDQATGKVELAYEWDSNQPQPQSDYHAFCMSTYTILSRILHGHPTLCTHVDHNAPTSIPQEYILTADLKNSQIHCTIKKKLNNKNAQFTVD